MTGKSLQWPFAAVSITAALFLLHALWIPVKAQVAQVLLLDAWARNLAGQQGAKPWPWADTSPVGILEVPGRDIEQVVLEGASGRNLAFGPAALTPVGYTDLVLSGHRDTHFRFLGDLEVGEQIRFTSVQGTREYLVTQIEIVDSRQSELVLDPGIERLSLLTCYPLDAPEAGGPLRLVVTAEAIL